MFSITSTKPILCDFCETYNPPENEICTDCGREIEKEFGYRGWLAKPKFYLMLSLFPLIFGIGSLLRYYPPGSKYYVRNGRYATSTEGDVFILGFYPLVMCLIFVAVAGVIKLKNLANKYL